MVGVTGLDYTSLESVMRLQGIKRRKRSRIFKDVRLIERGALDVITERQMQSVDDA